MKQRQIEQTLLNDRLCYGRGIVNPRKITMVLDIEFRESKHTMSDVPPSKMHLFVLGVNQAYQVKLLRNEVVGDAVNFQQPTDCSLKSRALQKFIRCAYAILDYVPHLVLLTKEYVFLTRT